MNARKQPEPHHFLKVDQIVDKSLVALLSERHIWKESETVHATRLVRQ